MPSQCNDPAAGLVREALTLYESNLIGYATSILGGDEERARDVVQDVYVRKVQKIDGKYFNVEFDKFAKVKDPGKT